MPRPNDKTIQQPDRRSSPIVGWTARLIGKPRSIARFFGLVLTVCGLAIACSIPAHAQVTTTSDAEFLAGLRQRQLYRLAETFCLTALENAELSQKDRAELVVQLTQTLAQHAMQTRGEQSDELWDLAYDTAEKFAVDNESSPWAVIVRAQAVLVKLDRGIWNRQRAEAAGDNPRLVEEALHDLADALEKIEKLTPQLLDALAKRSIKIDPEIPSRDQLLALQKNLKFQTARAQLQRAQCYPRQSPDFELAMIEATNLFDELSRLDTIDPLAWSAKLESIACYRLRGMLDNAQRRLETLAAEVPPPEVVLAARAEQVRVFLARGNLNAALGVFEQGIELQGRRSPELDFALLETVLAQWKLHSSSNTAAARQWQDRAIETVKRIKRFHSPYWALRAQTLLASNMTGGALTGDVATLAGNAQALLQQERIDDALTVFDQAVAAAEANNQPEEAFQLAEQAAIIQHERLEYADAVRRAREISLKYPRNAKAAETHLLAIHNAVQIAREANSKDLSQYVELLQEHQAEWPNDSTTGQVVWALARVYEHDSEWAKAADAYLRIPPQDSNALPGILAAARVYRQWLSGRRSTGEDVDVPAREAASVFERILFGPDPQRPSWPERWSPAQREAALAAVELRLLYTRDPFKRCLEILDRALRDNSIAPEEWRLRLKMSYIWALVGSSTDDNDKLAQARQMAESLSNAPPSTLITMLAGLADVAQQFPPDKRKLVGQLQYNAARPLYNAWASGQIQLDDTQTRELRVLTTAARATSGDVAGAVAMYQELLDKYPRDGDVIESFAKVLQTSGTPEHLRNSLEMWRQIERGSEAGSPRWYRAKLGLATAHEALGEKDQAAKIIQVTQALHPDLGGAELKQEFEAVLARCLK